MRHMLSKMDAVERKMDEIEKRLESKMDIQFKMTLRGVAILGVLITVYESYHRKSRK